MAKMTKAIKRKILENCTQVMAWDEVITTEHVNGKPQVAGSAVVVRVFNAPTLNLLVGTMVRFRDLRYSMWCDNMAMVRDGEDKVTPLPLAYSVHIEGLTLKGFEQELAAHCWVTAGHDAYKLDFSAFNSREASEDYLRDVSRLTGLYPDIADWFAGGRKSSAGLDSEA